MKCTQLLEFELNSPPPKMEIDTRWSEGDWFKLTTAQGRNADDGDRGRQWLEEGDHKRNSRETQKNRYVRWGGEDAKNREWERKKDEEREDDAERGKGDEENERERDAWIMCLAAETIKGKVWEKTLELYINFGLGWISKFFHLSGDLNT